MKSVDKENIFAEFQQRIEKQKDQSLPKQELIESYRSFFPKQVIEHYENKQNLDEFVSILQVHGIRYDAQRVSKDLEVVVVRESINSEVMVVLVKWGRFTMEICILNVVKQSEIHIDKPMVGSIKCIDFKRFRCSQSAVMMAIKEFAILKVAAALKIGPEIKNLIGFDLIIHYDCVQFAIQKCEQINELNQISKKNLMENLYVLHSLGVVHYDIKPSNVMYSKQFEKQVFIDFGLSEMLGISVGSKILMSFRGSLDFCSSEMEIIFYSNRMGLIDVFKNDTCCLESTFQWFYKLFSKCNIQNGNSQIDNDCINIRQPFKKLSLQFPLCLIKFMLFHDSVEQLTNLLHRWPVILNSPFIHQQMLNFFYQLVPNERIQSFYHNCILFHKKESIQYDELYQIYQSNQLYLKRIKPALDKKMIYSQMVANIRILAKQILLEVDRKSQIVHIFEEGYHLSMHNAFKLYMEFISFSNNIHEVKMRERVELTHKLYLRNYFQKKIQLQLNEDPLVLINQTIILMLTTLVNHRKQSKQSSREQLDLLLDMVEHVFIFSKSSCYVIIQILEQLFSLQTLSYEEKIQFLVKVKHFSYWPQYRLFFSQTTEGPHLNFEYVFNWIVIKINKLGEQQNQLNWVAQQIIKIWKFSLNEFDFQVWSKKFSMLPKHLFHVLTLQIKALIIVRSSPDSSSYNSLISSLYMQIEDKNKRKIYFWKLIVCQLMLFRVRDLGKSQVVLSLIEKNFESAELFNKLSLKYI